MNFIGKWQSKDKPLRQEGIPLSSCSCYLDIETDKNLRVFIQTLTYGKATNT
ncbi:MAG: hypothetical protein K6T73_03200 [Candidatus Bathyarchaeota archaeon]|nr:hypothetical protein [Candidatus Bathyarchaeota archaeon]